MPYYVCQSSSEIIYKTGAQECSKTERTVNEQRYL